MRIWIAVELHHVTVTTHNDGTCGPARWQLQIE